jgi:hypothetical protein
MLQLAAGLSLWLVKSLLPHPQPTSHTLNAHFQKMELPNSKNVAFVVAHPAHLLTVLGLVLKYKPRVLLLTHAFAGLGAGQAELIRTGFRMVGMEDRITDFEIDEAESYRRALAKDFAYHRAIVPRIVDWLESAQADVVFGDAFELSNYQHDVGRVMLDQAIKMLRSKGRSVANYEFPLSVRADRPGAELEFGRFIEGSNEEYALSQMDCVLKRKMVEMAKIGDSFISHVAPQFPGLEVERYRPVPADRDYLRVPAGMSLYYDDRGREEVQAGRYQQAIAFAEHFCPLVESLQADPALHAG